MDVLFSWTSAAILIAALLPVALIYFALGRIRFTFRFRGAMTVSRWTQEPCPHLGLLDEPFIHRDEPTEEHRCYLWMQRDRIDLTHQKGFCLSSAHTHCPWLSIAPPAAKPPVIRRVQAGVVGALSTAWRTLAMTVSRSAKWALPKLKRGVMASKRQVEVRAPAIAAGGAVAARATGKVLQATGRFLYTRLSSLAAGAVRQSGTTARGILSRQSRPATDLPQSTQPVAPAVGAPPEPRVVVAEVNVRPAPVPMPAAERGGLSHVESLIEQGKAAGGSGQRELAYSLFSLAVELDGKNDEAWLWKGAMANNADEKLACFQAALAINPDNQRAQESLAQMGYGAEPASTATSDSGAAGKAGPKTGARRKRGSSSGAASEPLSTEEALVTAALSALEIGDEEKAYRLFVSATEMNPMSEKAWFWRAKASTTLDELIFCLKQALAINPGNEKVKANLLWAIQRQQKEEKATEVERAVVAAPATPQEQAPRGKSIAAVALRYLSGLVCLALAAYWVSTALQPLVDTLLFKGVSPEAQGGAQTNLDSVRSFYAPIASWLPGLTWTSLPWYAKLEVAGNYNLLAAIPYTIGSLFLFVGVGLLRRESWSRYWGLAVAVLSLGVAAMFSSNEQGAILAAGLGLAAILTVATGWRDFDREPEEELQDLVVRRRVLAPPVNRSPGVKVRH